MHLIITSATLLYVLNSLANFIRKISNTANALHHFRVQLQELTRRELKVRPPFRQVSQAMHPCMLWKVYAVRAASNSLMHCDCSQDTSANKAIAP